MEMKIHKSNYRYSHTKCGRLIPNPSIDWNKKDKYILIVESWDKVTCSICLKTKNI